MLRIHAVAISAVLLSLIIAAPAYAASGESGIHYAKVVVEPDGSDFQVTVYYNTSFMTKFFSVLFGTSAIKAALADELAGFGNVTLVSLNTADSVAVFTVSNQSTFTDGWYMYDKKAHLSAPVDELVICGRSIERPLVISKAVEMPDFFYQ